MNVLDAGILAVMLAGTLWGLWQGLVRMVISWIALVGGLVAAYFYGERASELFRTWLENEAARMAMGYALVFFGVLFMGSLLGWLLTRMLETGGLKAVNRSLGALFGAAFGATASVLAVLMLTAAPGGESALVRDSALASLLTGAADFAVHTMPQKLREAYEHGRGAMRPAEEPPPQEWKEKEGDGAETSPPPAESRVP
jgi:membrane protein required for colicin V production